MAASSDNRKAYQAAKQELTDLIAKRKEVEERIVLVRQSLHTLATMCEREGIQIDPSSEASYLLEHSTLADEIRAILKSVWPGYLPLRLIKNDLERLGHDLSGYRNPQATIHMVLKRMIESGEVQAGTIPGDGKKTYGISGPETWSRRRAKMRAGFGQAPVTEDK